MSHAHLLLPQVQGNTVVMRLVELDAPFVTPSAMVNAIPRDHASVRRALARCQLPKPSVRSPVNTGPVTTVATRWSFQKFPLFLWLLLFFRKLFLLCENVVAMIRVVSLPATIHEHVRIVDIHCHCFY